MKALIFKCVLVGMVAVLSACSGKGGGKDAGGAGQSPSDKPPQSSAPIPYKGGPAELLVMDLNSGTTDEQFDKFFAKPIQAKYPEITLKETREPLDKLLAGGTPPDIVLVSNPFLTTLIDKDLPEDLTPMIKQYNVNLQRLDSAVVSEMKKLGQQKAFYGIPFAMNYGVLVYNKDIFEKFSVPYPKDTSNWNEILELAKRLTRTDSGVKYIGMIPPDLASMFWLYNLPVVKNDKAYVTSDSHKAVFSLLHQFYSIPGYIDKDKYSYSTDAFYKEERVAMMKGWLGSTTFYLDKLPDKNAFKWDLAAYPSFADHPGIGAQTDFHMAVVNKAGKHKDAAYQVLISLISDDVQKAMSKSGRLTVLSDDSIRNSFASDSGLFNGKNLASIFKVKPAPAPESSIWDPKINSLLSGEVTKNVLLGGMDINTALNFAEDKANKEIILK